MKRKKYESDDEMEFFRRIKAEIDRQIKPLMDNIQAPPASSPYFEEMTKFWLEVIAQRKQEQGKLKNNYELTPTGCTLRGLARVGREMKSQTDMLK